MNHFRLIPIGATLMFALICPAQQNTVAATTDKQPHGQSSEQSALSDIDQHMNFLSEKLGLSVDQEAKIKPIVQQMLDARQKLMRENLSKEAREDRERTLHEKADKQARKFLNDDQKKKLDQLEEERHP